MPRPRLVLAVAGKSTQFLREAIQTCARANDAPLLRDIVTVVAEPEFVPLTLRCRDDLPGKHGCCLTLRFSGGAQRRPLQPVVC